jgi:hypothetical protein
MVDPKEVKKPGQTSKDSKETTPEAARDLTEGDLEKVAGGDSGLETTALTCEPGTRCHELQ